LFEFEQPVHEEPHEEKTERAKLEAEMEEELEAERKLREFFVEARLRARALDAEEAERLAAEGNAQLAEIPEPEAELDIIAADAEHIASLELQRQETLAALDTLVEKYDELAHEKEHLQTDLETVAAQLIEVDTEKTEIKTQLEEAQQNNTLLDEQLTALVRYVAELESQIDLLNEPVAEPEPEVTEVKAEVVPEEEPVVVESPVLPVVEEPKLLAAGIDERPGDYVTPPEPSPEEATMINSMGLQWNHDAAKNGTLNNRKVYQAEDVIESGNTGFGIRFPDTAEKGDMFLRVDMMPNRAYKYNGLKWIEVDKNKTDVFAYDLQYIQHLSDKLDSGEFDAEDLNDIERAQIDQYRKSRPLL
jgi:hypothetical protein